MKIRNDGTVSWLLIRTCNRVDKEHHRVIRIPSNLHIGQVMLPEAYYSDVKAGKYPGLYGAGRA